MRTFRAYLVKKSLDTGFESWPADQMDTILSKFFTEARSEKGELYKKTTLISLMFSSAELKVHWRAYSIPMVCRPFVNIFKHLSLHVT